MVVMLSAVQTERTPPCLSTISICSLGRIRIQDQDQDQDQDQKQDQAQKELQAQAQLEAQLQGQGQYQSSENENDNKNENYNESSSKSDSKRSDSRAKATARAKAKARATATLAPRCRCRCQNRPGSVKARIDALPISSLRTRTTTICSSPKMADQLQSRDDLSFDDISLDRRGNDVSFVQTTRTAISTTTTRSMKPSSQNNGNFPAEWRRQWW